MSRLEISARHGGTPAGIRSPAGFMMLFVFSWPATTRPSSALWRGIEFQYALRKRFTEPLPKNPGALAGKYLRWRMQLRCYVATVFNDC